MSEKNTQQPTEFSKTLTTRHIFFVCLAMGVCSSSWGSALVGIGEGGTSFLIGAICAVIAYLLIAANYTELATTFPSASGLKAYAEPVFGETGGLIGSMLFVLCFLFGESGEITFASHILQANFPMIPWQAWALFFTTIFALGINLIGVKKVGEFENVGTVIVIVILLAVLVLALSGLSTTKADVSVISELFDKGITRESFFSTFLLAMWLFCGFECVYPLAEECKDPAKSLKKGVFGAIGMTAVLKVLFAFAAVMLVSQELLSGDDCFSAVGDAVLGKVGVAMMIVFVFVACAASIPSNMGASSRILYGMAEGPNNLMPKTLHYLHPRFKTPWKTLFLYWALTNIVILLFGSQLTTLMSIGSFIWVITYLFVIIINLKIRSKDGGEGHPYTVPGPTKKSPILSWVALVVVAIFIALSVSPQFGDPTILYVGGSCVVIVLAYVFIWSKVKKRV